MNFKCILILFCFNLLISCNHTQKRDIAKEKVRITSSLYLDLEGNSVVLDNFKGKRILLNFWATWCAPCLKEMPSMKRAQKVLKNENYVFLFATTDDLKKINQFIKNENYPFQFLQFKGTLDKLNIYALPTTFVYDTNGNQVKRIDGATEWDSKEMLNQLRAIK